jgi:hypothetical protein
MIEASEVDSTPAYARSSAIGIATAVNESKVTARAITEATLSRIAAINAKASTFTDVTEARSLNAADLLDARRMAGETIGSLAGVPFAAKKLLDVKGLATRAESKIIRDSEPAKRDAAPIERLEDRGAILVGTLNMGEYAFENAVLRHQLIVLRRRLHGRVRLTNHDRWFFIQLYRWFPSILNVLTIIRPLVRWHRAGFRCYWRWKSRRRGGWPQIETELRTLIRRMGVSFGSLTPGGSRRFRRERRSITGTNSRPY